MLSKATIASLLAIPDSRFKEGQRVLVATDQSEDPMCGVVLAPGPITMILLDREYRWPEDDSGLREVREDCLEHIL